MLSNGEGGTIIITNNIKDITSTIINYIYYLVAMHLILINNNNNNNNTMITEWNVVAAIYFV